MNKSWNEKQIICWLFVDNLFMHCEYKFAFIFNVNDSFACESRHLTVPKQLDRKVCSYTHFQQWDRRGGGASNTRYTQRWKNDAFFFLVFLVFLLHLKNHKLRMRLWLHKFLELCSVCGFSAKQLFKWLKLLRWLTLLLHPPHFYSYANFRGGIIKEPRIALRTKIVYNRGIVGVSIVQVCVL